MEEVPPPEESLESAGVRERAPRPFLAGAPPAHAFGGRTHGDGAATQPWPEIALGSVGSHLQGPPGARGLRAPWLRAGLPEAGGSLPGFLGEGAVSGVGVSSAPEKRPPAASSRGDQAGPRPQGGVGDQACPYGG